MIAAAAVVSLIASAGYLYLNWRALETHGLSFERKAAMAVAWIILICGLAFLLTRLGL